ncbi:hypothetical protein KC660_04370 [Candidatus Dojkabacteria bacterium]|uniref:Large ribosomal subunit protein uL24 C-terminal domain-containing protein n=1 Tax=Candidatus Dojkabacteria bacterium TaxID=2099670 RepID=A0A955L4A1_9BACT|nr:hypothetical protein [Candidatus Dojkabacteria bacterium]
MHISNVMYYNEKDKSASRVKIDVSAK